MMTEDRASSLQIEKRFVEEAATAPVIAETEKQRAAELTEALLSRDLEINQRRIAEEETERSYYALAIVNKLLSLSMNSTSIIETLQNFLDQVLSLPYLDLEPKGAILLVEDEPEVLKLKAHKGLAIELLTQCAQVRFGRCLCGRAAKTKEVVFADCIDERHDNRFPDMKPHGHYCIPILSAEKKMLGVFTLYTKAGYKRVMRIEEILLAVADVMASTIERLRVINEKEKLESHLQQAQKMEAIGTLAGGIAHDFNNILQAILGYANIVKDELPVGCQSRKDMEQIIGAGNRAKELVRQILTFSRQSNEDFSPVQIHLIVKEALKLLRSTIPSTIEIRTEIDSTSGVVRANPTQIHQVIMNLCTNAYHAMENNGGILDVSLNRVELGSDDPVKNVDLEPGGYLRLSVCDTGCGMNRDLIKNIFDPYFTTKKDGKGTGLGLSVVHGIVKNHGGTITVYSEPEKGTTFNIYLPEIEIYTAPVALSSEPIPQGEDHILIVDDEEPLVQLMQRMLTSLGYRITSRTSSVEALQAFCNDPKKIDLVITDMAMPNMTGTQLALEILKIRPDMPIILCTGFSEGIKPEKAMSLGIREYVNKPVIKREIATIIRKLLDGAVVSPKCS